MDEDGFTTSGEHTPRSVYQRVLGDAFGDLDPQLQEYFGPLPDGVVGEGVGVYDVAGSRHRWLWPVFAVMAWRRLLFPELGAGVPFTVRNTRGDDGTLSAVRTFRFPHVERRMEDTMSVEDGLLVDRLGKRRGLEVELALEVRDGDLRMTSRRLGLRLAGARVPLGPLVTVHLHERADAGRQHVEVRITMPVLGELFRYAGAFSYSRIASRG